jgi:hypothetical protein
VSGPVTAGRAARYRAWLVLLLFLVLAVVHTWPLATGLGTHSRVDNADTELNAWAVSWVARQLARDPLHLFDANIFYPERHTLAFSEPIIPPAILAMPLRWAGASPITTYNVLLIAGLALTGFGMYVLVCRVTGDVAAAVLAGCLLTFNAQILTRFPHLQAFHAQWLPLALWALDRVLLGGTRRDLVWLSLCCLMAALTSGYLGVFVGTAVICAIAARGERLARPGGAGLLGRLAVAGLAAVAMAAAVLWPYVALGDEIALQRPIELIATYSANLSSYLSTGGRLHYTVWSHHFYQYGTDSLFPGVAALALAGFGVARWSDRGRVRMFLLVGLVGLVLSLGPETPVYRWVYAVVPPVRAIREVSRFGYLALFAVAALGGLGLAAWRRRIASESWAAGIGIAAILVVNLEALRAPIAYTPFKGFSPIYQMIADTPGVGVIAEFPFHAPERTDLNGPYVLASTVHWKPILNGYSGIVPPSYVEMSRRLEGFPAAASIDTLRETGVTHVVIHPFRYDRYDVGKPASEVLAAATDQRVLELVAEDSTGSRLYRIR